MGVYLLILLGTKTVVVHRSRHRFPDKKLVFRQTKCTDCVLFFIIKKKVVFKFARLYTSGTEMNVMKWRTNLLTRTVVGGIDFPGLSRYKLLVSRATHTQKTTMTGTSTRDTRPNRNLRQAKIPFAQWSA